MAQNDLYDFTTMLDEAQRKLDRQFESVRVLRDHAKIVFGASSVIVSLFAVLKTANISQDRICIYTTVLIAIAVLYICLTITGTMAIFPETITGPIKAKYDEYEKAYEGKTKKKILLQQISNYLNVIDENEEKIIKQRRWSFAVSCLLPLIVVLIIILGLIPIFP